MHVLYKTYQHKRITEEFIGMCTGERMSSS